jgi:hypothetical protein
MRLEQSLNIRNRRLAIRRTTKCLLKEHNKADGILEPDWVSSEMKMYILANMGFVETIRIVKSRLKPAQRKNWDEC